MAGEVLAYGYLIQTAIWFFLAVYRGCLQSWSFVRSFVASLLSVSSECLGLFRVCYLL